jgi:lysophospholipase L1-like esterase
MRRQRRGRVLVLAAVLTAGVACSGSGAGSGDRTPTADGLPRSMAALGDSMTRAFILCDGSGDCPEASWSTGSAAEVRSHSQRLSEASGQSTRAHNVAVSGATVAGLAGQARRAVAAGADYVTVLIGANDACAPSEADMTPVAAYSADFERALSTVVTGLPRARILVVSIPDLLRLWQVGRDDERVLAVWQQLSICQSMLADPTDESAEAGARRARVRQRVVDYNTAMSVACGRHPTCRSDRGAVFDYDFTIEMVSERDYWHPSRVGQRTISEVSWAAGYWPEQQGG